LHAPVGCSTLCRLVELENDCVMPRIRWTPEEDERLLDLIAAGKSWTLISGMLKRSMKSVKLHAKTLRLVGAKENEG
jgi:DNA-binding NarL/FixJ family response regulator